MMALHALGEIGSAARPRRSLNRLIVSALSDAIVKHRATPSEDEDVTYLMLLTLRRFGPDARYALPGLKACLSGFAELEVEPAYFLLKRLGADGVRVLGEFLQDRKPRSGCLVAGYGQLGAEALPYVPALVEFLNDESASTRLGAAQSLLHLDYKTTARLVVPVVIDSLKHLKRLRSEGIDEHWIFPILYKLGPDGGPAVPALLAYLRGEDAPDLIWAAEILGYMGSAAQDALPTLRKLAETPFESRLRFRVAAALALWRIGRDARAVTILSSLAKVGPDDAQNDLPLFPHDEPFKSGRENGQSGAQELDALDALVEIGPPAHGALVRLVRDQENRHADPLQKAWRVAALARLERRHHLPHEASTAEAVTSLTKLLGEEQPEKTARAAQALIEFGLDARSALPGLINALDREDVPTRVYALFALSAMGPAAQAAVPAIVKLLVFSPEPKIDSEENRWNRRRISLVATEALGHIDPDNPRLLPALLDHLKEGAFDLRVFDILAALGPRAKPAGPALIRVIRLADEPVFAAGLRALRTVDPSAAEEIWPR
jgi:HEAT repeat protein